MHAPMRSMETDMHDTPEENGSAVQVRLRGPLYERLENWRRAQRTIPPRSEALRELIDRALTADEAAA